MHHIQNPEIQLTMRTFEKYALFAESVCPSCPRAEFFRASIEKHSFHLTFIAYLKVYKNVQISS